MILLLITIPFLIALLITFNLVSKADNLVILWPEYFDRNLTKKAGRRVPVKLAANNPSVEDIARAAKRLKLRPKIELNKAYPSRWWRKNGRVLVQAKVRKTKIIRQVAIVMKKYRK